VGPFDECVLLLGGRSIESLARLGADQRQDRARLGHVLEAHVTSEAVRLDRVRKHGAGDGLAVEPEPAVAAEDAQIGAQLALVSQDRRVATAPRGQPLDVVGHLSLHEIDDLPAAQQELGAVRSIDEPDRLLQQFVGIGRDHPSDSRPRGRRHTCR
jgi:hypothetical protein